MGNLMTKDHIGIEKYTFPQYWSENWPSSRTESPYDPLEGFPNGRKPRVMIATEAEMDSAKLPPKLRDYCAHKYIEFKGCLKHTSPFYWRCRHKRHEYAECQFEDMVIRMKEWERERRLRQKEIDQQKAAA